MRRKSSENSIMALYPDVPYDFELGDRITYQLYGTGIVTGSLSAVMTLSKMSLKLEPNGWRMEILWDGE
jgi:hypothetical protein